MLMSQLKLLDSIESIDLIIPVPTHWSKHIKRGYSHMNLIGYAMSQQSNIKCDTSLLYKSRLTKSQTGLSQHERLRNLSNAFSVSSYLHNKNIVLIDDVKTTGATLEECARTLKKAYAKRIYAITLASTKDI